MEVSHTEQRYTLGFIFNGGLTKVLLVHKQRPAWQQGRVNGVGGKYEKGETSAACIMRETEEETALRIPEDAWVPVGVLHQEVGDVGVFAAKYDGKETDAVMSDHEEIEWFAVDALPENVMDNLQWLVPMSLERLKGGFSG